MYHEKTSNDQVNRVEKRALRTVHNDFNMQLEILLDRIDEDKVHTRNLQKLMHPKCLSQENPSSCGYSLKEST